MAIRGCEFKWDIDTGKSYVPARLCNKPAEFMWRPISNVLKDVHYSCRAHMEVACTTKPSVSNRYTIWAIKGSEAVLITHPEPPPAPPPQEFIKRLRINRVRRENVPIDESE